MSATRDKSVARFRALAQELQRDIRANAIFQLHQEADELVDQMKAVAPIGPTGNLRKSIRKQQGKDDLHVSVKAGGPLTTVKNKRGHPYDYSLAVEFGASGNAAHPFFWPSWRLRRRKIRGRMKRKVTAAIKAKSAG